MDLFYRELLVHRICSGLVKIDKCFVRQPSSQDCYIVLDYCQNLYSEALSLGLHTSTEHSLFMANNNFWIKTDQDQYDNLIRDLDGWKINLFQSFYNEKHKVFLRGKIKDVKKELSILHNKRHFYDHLCIDYFINIQKSKFLLGLGLFKNNKRLFENIEKIERSTRIDGYFEKYINSRIAEDQYRELARTDPWKSQWSCKEASSSVFNIPVCDLNYEQKQLVLCSMMYDSIRKHPECPDEKIFEDDDCLDGWMILQRRKYEAEKSKSTIDSTIANDKIRNSDEIMIMSDGSPSSIEGINRLNDPSAMRTKKERFNYLSKHGIVREEHMPDSKRKIRELAFQRG